MKRIFAKMSNEFCRLFLLVVFFSSFTAIRSRTVPAKDDICTRYPSFSLCVGNQAQAAADQHPTAPLPPTAPPPVGKQIIDREAYCKKYELHFTYFCSPGINQEANAKEFCNAYNKNCDIKRAPQAYTNEQISTECAKKKTLAETYCTGNEPAAIKSQCDLYRQYCLTNGGPVPTAPVAPVAGDANALQYCTANQQNYVAQCQNRAAVPSAPSAPAGGGDAAALAASHGYTPEKINALCTQYQNLAQTYCTGDEKPGIKDKCDLYRTYCQGNQPQSVSQQLQQQPSPQANPFCQQYVQTCAQASNVAPPNSQLAYLCSNFVYMTDTFCPGYETAESRITCNNYRVYCQHKQPFRDIDGVYPVNQVNNQPNWAGSVFGG